MKTLNKKEFLVFLKEISETLDKEEIKQLNNKIGFLEKTINTVTRSHNTHERVANNIGENNSHNRLLITYRYLLI